MTIPHGTTGKPVYTVSRPKASDGRFRWTLHRSFDDLVRRSNAIASGTAKTIAEARRQAVLAGFPDRPHSISQASLHAARKAGVTS